MPNNTEHLFHCQNTKVSAVSPHLFEKTATQIQTELSCLIPQTSKQLIAKNEFL